MTLEHLVEPILHTRSYQLAAYIRGDLEADKLAIVMPGKLDTKDYAHMQSHVDFLSKRGYLAVSFDPPGTWGSPGDISLYKASNWLGAIDEVIEHFDSRSTVLMGHSRGGSMAMIEGSRNDKVTHIIAAMSPGTGSRSTEQIRYDGFKVSSRDSPGGVQREFRLPLSYFEDDSQYDAIDHISKCTKPKLFVVGTKDRLITPDIVRATYERSPEPKQLYEIDSEHDYRFHPALIEEMNQVLGDFLDRYQQF